MIIPHGLLELSAIVLAGAAGMSIGLRSSPGDRHRSAALAEEARRAIIVIIGLILVFTVAGLIEGFITPGFPPSLDS
ncbi:MAG: stage II sporulation protein M [Acidimicrobiales bacterium]